MQKHVHSNACILVYLFMIRFATFYWNSEVTVLVEAMRVAEGAFGPVQVSWCRVLFIFLWSILKILDRTGIKVSPSRAQPTCFDHMSPGFHCNITIANINGCSTHSHSDTRTHVYEYPRIAWPSLSFISCSFSFAHVTNLCALSKFRQKAQAILCVCVFVRMCVYVLVLIYVQWWVY